VDLNMVIINHSLNRRIRQALYTLKRGFGSTVKLHKLTKAETNYKTGVKELNSTSITIHRCIVLPTKVQREVVQTVLVANKEFSYGGSYDTNTRIFIIDARDLPKGYIIQNDDWIEFENYRYNLKIIEELEQHTGWTITAKRVIGPTIMDVELSNEPMFTQVSTNVKS
jgi:hypothetical protein